MKRALVLAGLLVCVLSGISVPAVASPVSVQVVVAPTRIETVLGDRFTLETKVRNTGNAGSGPLLAHLNVASLESSVYVDPEDWSADRSQELSLEPGESRTLSWKLQAVNSGRFAAYVVVLPSGGRDAAIDEPVVTPVVSLDVSARSNVSAAGALPVVLGTPILLGVTAIALRSRIRRR